jgi:hypothetical protein
LEALKEIVCILAQAEDENIFVVKVLPIVAEAMQVAGELLFYARFNETDALVAGGDGKTLENTFTDLRMTHGMSRDALVIEVSMFRRDTPLATLAGAGVAAYVFIPIYYGDRDMGFLALPYPEPASFSNDERLFLTCVSETIGIFLRNIQLNKDYTVVRQDMDQRMNELVAVYAVSTAISADLDVCSILEKALDAILGQEILRIEAKGGVFLLNERPPAWTWYVTGVSPRPWSRKKQALPSATVCAVWRPEAARSSPLMTASRMCAIIPLMREWPRMAISLCR